MELVNATPMIAGYTLGMEPSGREHIVVALKGTFAIPPAGPLQLAGEQVPLIMADTFTGEPGFSAPVYEADYPLAKPRCDVLLHGSAYAPGGTPAERVTVELRVGSLRKQIEVVGDRVLEETLTGVRPSAPRPFQSMPITYDRAYGGVDVDGKRPERSQALTTNPVGRGFYPLARLSELPGRPVANTHQPGHDTTTPRSHYRPMAFGPVGRSWVPRAAYAGTYDDHWMQAKFPFLPDDFDPRYYQSAPDDQQIDHPTADLDVHLTNLTPTGTAVFRIPYWHVPIEFTDDQYKRTEKPAALDTIVIEPDLGRVLLTWRASMPLKCNVFELKQAVVGRMPRGWYRARETGKTYYSSLEQLARVRRGESEEVTP